MNTSASLQSNFAMQSEAEIVPRPTRIKIIRAAHLGMCFGVRDAISLALDESSRRPLTILGELVHNESVLAELRARFHPVIIGKRDHVEVRGLTGDLKEFDIVLTEADIAQLIKRPRFGIAAQTTQPVEKVCRLATLIQRRFPGSEVRFIDTVCQPTKQRQTAAIKLAQQSDVVLVIGGQHSNNTRELAATCQTYCPRVHHIQSAGDIRAEWFEGARIVGITAGTSTPEWTIDAVEQWLRLNL